MNRLATLTVLLLALGCNVRGMGQTCSSSKACAGDGVCLKGVCSGYACEADGDCSEDLICGSVLGARSCQLECSTDADCLGEQACTEVQRGLNDEEATAFYCM